MIRKIQLRLIASVPMLITLVLAVFVVAPKHIGNLSAVMPLLQLVPVFIWGVMHARDVSFVALALIGLFVDVATGMPLGISALSYCLFFLLVLGQRKYIYREGFAAMWGYFALLLFIMQAISFALYSYSTTTMALMGNALLQWLFTLLFYPPLHFILYPLVEKLGQARYRLLHA